MHTLTNDELISDLPQTLQLMAEGLGHFLRLALAGYVHDHPECAARMSALLNATDERAELSAALCQNVLEISVAVRPRDADHARPIMSTRTNLSAMRAPH